MRRGQTVLLSEARCGKDSGASPRASNEKPPPSRLLTSSETFVLQRGVADGLQGELDELRRRNRLLQEQVKRTRHQPEKPYEELQAKDQPSVRTQRTTFSEISR